MVVSKNTINLLGEITKPLAAAGALPKSERQAFIQILNRHTQEAEGVKVSTQKRGLKISDVCNILNVSRSTVQRMIQRGELRGHYLRPGSPKTLRVDPASVDAVLRGEVQS